MKVNCVKVNGLMDVCVVGVGCYGGVNVEVHVCYRMDDEAVWSCHLVCILSRSRSDFLPD